VLLIFYQKLVSHHHFFLFAGKLGECQAHFGVKGTLNEGQSSGTTKEDSDCQELFMERKKFLLATFLPICRTRYTNLEFAEDKVNA